jgi:drug/metabolite transporter superfamily protein YnfA
MRLMRRTGIAVMLVGLMLMVFTALRTTKSAEASGPYSGMYSQVCIQTGTVVVWQWQFDGYAWRWVAASQTVCLRWATVAVYQPAPYYPIYYSPVGACGYNGCIYRTPYYGQPYYGNQVVYHPW